MVAIPVSGYAQQTPYKSLVARAPDGVSIAVQDWGNPEGPEILFQFLDRLTGLSSSTSKLVDELLADGITAVSLF